MKQLRIVRIFSLLLLAACARVIPVLTPTVTITAATASLPALHFTPSTTPIPLQTDSPEPIAGTEIVDSKGLAMVYVPSGVFIMGSDTDYWDGRDENPSHKVYLDGYYIDVFEVTNAAYAMCVHEAACHEHLSRNSYTREDYYGNPEYANYPLVYVAYYNAVDFCNWRGARLPTEAEWEKAARGTDGRTYPWGEKIDCRYANYNDCKSDATRVGSYPLGKSPYGAFDMAGNVWEFVSDYYDGNYYNTLGELTFNPLGGAIPGDIVIKGGAWFSGEFDVTTSSRSRDASISVLGTGGFRCAKSIDE